MKIRSNYVSNSSSSSYIVEYKNPEDKITIWGKDITVEDFLNQIMFYTYGDENELFENTFENDEDKALEIGKTVFRYLKEEFDIDWDETINNQIEINPFKWDKSYDDTKEYEIEGAYEVFVKN